MFWRDAHVRLRIWRRVEEARRLGGIQGTFVDWWNRVREAEKGAAGQQPGQGGEDEGKSEVERSFDECKEHLDEVALIGEGWEGCEVKAKEIFKDVKGAEDIVEWLS